MLLKNISLTNFRGLSLSLSFADKDQKLRLTTVLLGENGVGKSNLLKSIALLTSGSEALGELLGNVDDWISFGESECKIEGTISKPNVYEKHLSLRLKRGQTLKDVIVSNITTLDTIDSILHADINESFILGYGAGRRLNKGTDFSRVSEDLYRSNGAKALSSLFNSDAQLKSLVIWAMELDYESGSKKLNVVIDVLNDLLPGIRFKSIDKINKELIFMVGGDQVPLSLLSEGYQSLAAFIGDVLYRISRLFKNSTSLANLRGILLIDEVDLHIHPKWQQYLMRFLKAKFPKFQIIITTHSAIVAQQTNVQELYFLTKGEHGIVELSGFQGNPSDLLLHQLLLSPAFGLASDESIKVQDLKSEYREMKSRKNITLPEERRLKKLSAELMALPQSDRSKYVAEPSQIEAILEVRDELINLRKK